MSLSPLPPGTVLREPKGSFRKRVIAVLIALPFAALIAQALIGIGPTVVLAVAGLALFYLAARDSLVAALRWNRPLLQVSSTPYALGSNPVVVYRRKPKRVTDISSCTVTCLLVCEERVTYTHGTDTRTDTRRVYESQSTGAGVGTSEGLVAEIELGISARLGAPTFQLPNNEVHWFVEVRSVGERLPRDTHTFVIDVGAVLDPSHRLGVQDS